MLLLRYMKNIGMVLVLQLTMKDDNALAVKQHGKVMSFRLLHNQNANTKR